MLFIILLITHKKKTKKTTTFFFNKRITDRIFSFIVPIKRNETKEINLNLNWQQKYKGKNLFKLNKY